MAIKPTLGRVLWFTPHPAAGIQDQQTAHIAKVNDDGTLNLMVIAPDGYPYGVQSVPLVQDDEDKPSSAYAEWMPYQLGQAAKTQEVLNGAANAPIATATVGNVTSSDASSTGETDSNSASGEQTHETLIERVEDGFHDAVEKAEESLGIHHGDTQA
jgi:hypothetical protein